MTQSDLSTPDLSALRARLERRLSAFGQRVRNHLLLEGAARVLAVTVALALFTLLVDRWLRLGVGTRIALGLIALGALAFEAWRHILTPLRMRLGPVALAAVLDRRAAAAAAASAAAAHRRANGAGHAANGNPSNGNGKNGNGSTHPRDLLAPRVASVLELPRLVGGSSSTSEAMVRSAVLRCHRSLEAVEFDSYLDRRRRQLMTAAVAGLLLLPVLFTIVAPRTASLWARRWLLGSSVPWPQKTHLVVAGLVDGKLIVPRGEPAVLRVSLREGSEEPESVTLRLRTDRGGKTDGTLNRYGPGDWRYDLPALQSAARVELEGGDDEVGPITVEPVDRPRITRFELASRHPTQAKGQVHAFSGQEADNAFLPKTELELRFTANVPVAEARVRAAQPTPGAADLKRAGEKDFAIGWVHERPVHLEVELVGAVGGLTSLPTPVSIGMKTDAPPRVTLQYSGVRQRVSPAARVPLVAHARDDYGLAGVELLSKAEAGIVSDDGDGKAPAAGAAATKPAGPVERTVTLVQGGNPAERTEVRQAHEMQLAAMQLSPGALLSVTGRATDASYTGAQTAQSRTVTFRVVRAEELFREILLRQQSERAKFRKALGEAEKIRDVLATVATREAAAQAAGQHRLVQREAKRIANSLRESLTEMQLNALGGQEAFDLMETSILKPLAALDAELMDPQRQALDRLGGEAAPASERLTEAAARQEQVVEKMREILKAMAQWDSFVDVLNQLNEIIRIQEGVRKTTEQIKDKETEGLFKD